MSEEQEVHRLGLTLERKPEIRPEAKHLLFHQRYERQAFGLSVRYLLRVLDTEALMKSYVALGEDLVARQRQANERLFPGDATTRANLVAQAENAAADPEFMEEYALSNCMAWCRILFRHANAEQRLEAEHLCPKDREKWRFEHWCGESWPIEVMERPAFPFSIVARGPGPPRRRGGFDRPPTWEEFFSYRLELVDRYVDGE